MALSNLLPTAASSSSFKPKDNDDVFHTVVVEFKELLHIKS